MENCDCKTGKMTLFASLILGLSLIAGATVVSLTIYNAKKLNDTLSVIGSTKQKVMSDSVKWRSSFSRTVAMTDLKGGYAQMAKDEKAVTKFLTDKGVKKEDIVVSAVTMNEVYKPYDNGTPKEYALSQMVEVNSGDIQKINGLTKQIQPLIDQGILFSIQSTEYYTSKLPEMRVALLGDAIKDAKARAEKIAESSGKQVGAIQSANMGVVQVLAPNSVDISDYGNYDTSSMEKEVMVTVRAVFRLK